MSIVPTALQCKNCKAIWTRQTVLDDACPQCGGEIVDITDTHTGQEFLRIISIPAEIRHTKLDKQTIYATGVSSIFSSHARKP